MQDLFLKFVGNASPLEITLIVVLGFTFYILLKKQINGLGQRLDGRIDKTNNRLDSLEAKLDSKIDALEVKLDKFQSETKSEIKSINARIDKLYDLILDLYRTLSRKDAA